MEKSYTFEELTEIVAALRSEHGCPWDKKQTHGSLRTCMIEEAYEVVDGIRILEETGNWDNLCEELGDVLLQVMLHSQIAKENGNFSVEDVISGISAKMIRRHPHVFGDGSVSDSEEVVVNWDEIKKREKKDQKGSELDSIPQSFPALIRTSKVLKKLESGKQMYTDEKESFANARALLEQLEQGEDDSTVMGNLLIEICNIARKKNIHAEQALSDQIDKLIVKNR